MKAPRSTALKVALGVRSHYSLMRGTAPVKELVKYAKRLGYERVALTDRNNLYGLWPFLKACKEEGVKPIVGAEITDTSSNTAAFIFVKSAEGYSNLCRLISSRRCDANFSLESGIIKDGGGLFLLTTNATHLEKWHSAGIDVAAAVPRSVNEFSAEARRAARSQGLPCVAVADSFFLRPKGFEFHKLLRAIELNTSLSRVSQEELAPENSWLAPPEEYERRFNIMPEALEGAELVAELCPFEGPKSVTIFPSWGGNGIPPDEALRREAYRGAMWRYGIISDAARARLEYELKVIEEKGFSTYFLVVRDIVKRSPRICGRGSGAASLVAYSLGITNVCPIKHNLYFERFLNPGRIDPPDIDVDFAWDERDDVIASVLEEHAGHSAMVCNHVFFQPRMAVRETAKVFGLSEREISEVSKKVPWTFHDRSTGMETVFRSMPQMRGIDFGYPWPEILKLASRLVGTPRNLSVHPGGVVITPNRIESYVPIENAKKGVPVIQWEKDGAEEAGLVKIDLLGNRSLGVIRDAIAEIRRNGRYFDESRWEPEDDPETQKSVSKGDTMGCFYIESPATRLLQKKAGTGDFEHMVIHSSIIRPAANEFIREYLRRLHGGEWEPIHPLLENVLDETYGIMVYQEDVSKVAVSLAGFSHSSADLLRKIMSKKDKGGKLEQLKEKFASGASKNGVTRKQIEEIWRMILSFDGYSFCKPHSASYARVSFQSAYLKVHYPAEFMAAVISNRGGFYSEFAYVSEAKRMGCVVLPPDINESDVKWRGNAKRMRVGLQSIANLGSATMERIVFVRPSGGYRSFKEFLSLVTPAEDEARSLIYSGAFESLEKGKSQAELLWQLALWRKRREDGASPIFDGDESISKLELPPESEIEKLRREYSSLGFLCGCHPIVLYEKAVAKAKPVKVKDIEAYIGKGVGLAGWLITGKTVQTKKGDSMKFITFEDETGILETVFFPKVYAKYIGILESHKPYFVRGKVEVEFGAVTLNAESLRTL